MGYSQGKMLKPDDLYTSNSEPSISNLNTLLPLKENFTIISKSIKKNVECKIIEFNNNDLKTIDCEISLNKINFEEAYEIDYIFEAVITVFETLSINFPLIIYLNIENSRINLFLKLNSVDEIIIITNKFIQLIKNFNKLVRFTNDIDYKVHKKPEIQTNYSPLNSNSHTSCFNTSNSNRNNIISNISNIINDNINTPRALKSEDSKVKVPKENEENKWPITNYPNKGIGINPKQNIQGVVKQRRQLTYDNFENNTIINNMELKHDDKNIPNVRNLKIMTTAMIPTTSVIDGAEVNCQFNENLSNKNFENNIKNFIIAKPKDISESNHDYILDTEIQLGLGNGTRDGPENHQTQQKHLKTLNLNQQNTEDFIFENNCNQEEIFKNKLYQNENKENNRSPYEFIEAQNFFSGKNFAELEIQKNKAIEESDTIQNFIFETNSKLNLIDQPKEAADKLVKELLTDDGTKSYNNLLFNQSFLNSENSEIKIREDEINAMEESQQKNQITRRNFSFADPDQAINEPIGNLQENNFTTEKNDFNTRDADDNDQQLINQNSGTLELNSENSNKNFVNSKHPNFNYFNNKFHQEKIFKKNQIIKQNALRKNNINNTSNNNNFKLNNNMNLTNNMSSNNSIDNIGFNNQRTRNYYISNILNFNPNTSERNNFSNQQMPPSCLNQNMVMMKNMNYNPYHNNQNFLNNNFVLNSFNGFPNSNLANNTINSNINCNSNMFSNKNTQLIGNISNPLMNNFSINNNTNSNSLPFQSFNPPNKLIQNSSNSTPNNNSNISNSLQQNNCKYIQGFEIKSEDIKVQSKSNTNNVNKNNLEFFSNSENNNKKPEKQQLPISKEFEEKVNYLEDKINLIPICEDYLEGFYFKKFDYQTDEDFVSFYLIGNFSSENTLYESQEILSQEKISDIQKYFIENYNILLKHIIYNPTESSIILRLVFYKLKMLAKNFNTKRLHGKEAKAKEEQLQTELENLDFKKIAFLNYEFILIKIKSKILKLYPEELYVDLQLKLVFEVRFFNEIDFKEYLEQVLNFEFFEITFFNEGECILTVFDKQKLKEIKAFFIDNPLHQIRKGSNSILIQAEALDEPFPIYGSRINIVSPDSKPSFPERPPVTLNVIRGNYTPSLKKLMMTKYFWKSYKIEKNNFNIVNPEEFFTELSISDIDKIRYAYPEKNYERKLDLVKITITDCSNKTLFRPKISANRLKITPTSNANIISNLNNTNSSNNKRDSSTISIQIENTNNNPNANKDRETDENYYDENINALDESASESEENNNDSESEFSESKAYSEENSDSGSERIMRRRGGFRGRGRPRKRINQISYNNTLANKTRASYSRSLRYNNRVNNMGIDSFSRNYSNLYTISKKIIDDDSSFDFSKPNIIDELIQSDLEEDEKKLLEKMERDIQERVFKKNDGQSLSKAYENFVPRKRGRRSRINNLSYENNTNHPNNITSFNNFNNGNPIINNGSLYNNMSISEMEYIKTRKSRRMQSKKNYNENNSEEDLDESYNNTSEEEDYDDDDLEEDKITANKSSCPRHNNSNYIQNTHSLNKRFISNNNSHHSNKIFNIEKIPYKKARIITDDTCENLAREAEQTDNVPDKNKQEIEAEIKQDESNLQSKDSLSNEKSSNIKEKDQELIDELKKNCIQDEVINSILNRKDSSDNIDIIDDD